MIDGVKSLPIPGDALRPSRGPTASSFMLRSFLVGPENRLADEAVHSVLGSSPTKYHPLVIVGPAGAGKTHLARGLAYQWVARNRADSVLFFQGNDLARQFAEAVDSENVSAFRRDLRQTGLLVVDDVHQLSQKRSLLDNLICTLDSLEQNGGTAVFTSRMPLHTLSHFPAALISRLSAGLVVALALPDTSTRTAILLECAHSRQIPLCLATAQLLAKRLPVGAAQLEEAFLGLHRQGSLNQKKSLSSDLAGQFEKTKPRIASVIGATARHFSLRPDDLLSASRQRAMVTARGIAMYLARELTGESLKKIGRATGGRDHTTVLHHCRKVKNLCGRDPEIRQAVDEIKETIQRRQHAWKSR